MPSLFSALVDRTKRLSVSNRINYVFISVDKNGHFLYAFFLRPWWLRVMDDGEL